MADTGLDTLGPNHGPGVSHPSSRWVRLVASPKVQALAARLPILGRIVRCEGAAMFDIVAGFCHTQILMALVQLRLTDAMLDQELSAEVLAQRHQMPPERMRILLRGGVAIGLLKQRQDGRFALTTRGAALAGVPGLQDMIRHHDVLYRDLADPVAFFRGEVDTELAAFWPYVFGAGAADDPEAAARYSRLMADSQSLVAADTIAALRYSGVRHVMDVGGGTGAFLAVLGRAVPDVRLTLFDLPAVVGAARDRFDAAGLSERTHVLPGSFRDDPLPAGADMITLVRVLYDHADDTVLGLLRAVRRALPAGGRVVISEPMTGGETPERAGDAYFALYCMAMQTGRARSADEIADLLQTAGFAGIRKHRPRRAYVTSVVEAVSPA